VEITEEDLIRIADEEAKRTEAPSIDATNDGQVQDTEQKPTEGQH